MEAIDNKEIIWEETLPEEYQIALNELFGDKELVDEKLDILIKELGDSNIHYMGMYKDSIDEIKLLKMRVLELEYLAKIGLYKPEYY